MMGDRSWAITHHPTVMAVEAWLTNRACHGLYLQWQQCLDTLLGTRTQIHSHHPTTISIPTASNIYTLRNMVGASYIPVLLGEAVSSL